jgi:hypothetical protein
VLFAISVGDVREATRITATNIRETTAAGLDRGD